MSYLPPFWFAQFRDALGNSLSNAKLYSYENLSTIPKPLYSDHDLNFPHTNPIDLDSYGYLPTIYLLSGYYTFSLVDQNGIVIKTADWIEGSLGANTEIGSSYTLSAATVSALGGIKVGNGLAIDGNGVLSVLPTSAQTISLSAYATLSGSNFSGSVTSPTFSANSISAISYSTSSITITEKNSILKVTGNSNYYQDCGISFGIGDAGTIKSVEGVLQLGSEDSYGTFIGSNFYITSANLIVGDPSVANNLGEKSLILNQQLQSNYRAIFNSSAFILDKFKNKTLSTDSTGQLIGYEIGSVMYDTGDSPRPLKYKIRAGTGCVITTASDGANGVVMSINARGNSWRLIKNISTATYTILDTDDVVINLNTNSVFTLPAASSLYEGRVVQIRGGLLGSTVTVNSLGTIVGGPSVVITNYDKREFLCYFNSVQWQWVITN